MKLDSKLEEIEYRNLLLRQAAHEIEDLEVQVVTKLIVNDCHVANFKCDFVYTHKGIRVWKECKGYFHEQHRMRFKLFVAMKRDEKNRIVLQEKTSRQFYEVKVENQKIKFLERGVWKPWRF